MIHFSPEIKNLTENFVESQLLLPYSKLIFQQFFAVSGTTQLTILIAYNPTSEPRSSTVARELQG